ncbi:hypothetical protein G6F57_008820 [Rhizopus arrhizus]|uniref:Uncharacterized protein n=1 Tax=Rhizopus oryzae TaxID=64495 RepID=A0A9P6X516_RHIOR|nr:hypothetical protein G6F23_012192 [Rhizopus arrhizus]KAG0759185.1 hypothetical protein G6F24_009255 [Rhizopus arrhizus]KAG0907579.1 hypothetical protein G6F33_010448 [Rhizopus arrhizus]KAG0934201.1 hypothetical protein G6F30_009932 [Rhizopus arrhizus]KAG0977279.1 hypothetical protein G6F29_010191 [Rhizopus arrhizus]
MFPLKSYTLDEKIDAHFLVVAAKCKASNNSSDARQYLQKIISGRKELKVIEQVLDILDEEKFLFQSISRTNLITEQDIVSKIWAPFLKKTLSVGGDLVRTKLGESISQYSQAEKQLQYVNMKHTKTFKVDIRFLYDLNGNEYDVGAGEATKEASDEAKILSDKSKLLREGKDVLDRILNTVIPEDDAKNAIGHTIQIKGLCAQVISVYLNPTGLYIAKPLFKIYFPASLLDLSDFREGLKNIFHFAHLLEDNAKLYESAVNSRKRRLSCIGSDYSTRESKQPGHSLLSSMKPTYYTPSNGNRTYSVFNHPNTHQSINTPSPEPTVEENGWVLMQDGKWFHHEAMITLDTSPYEE